MLHPSALTRLATALGGLPILGCVQGSPADIAGIRYGDIVLSLNGVRTASWSDFFQARRQSSGDALVRVFRQGAEFEAPMALSGRVNSPRAVLDEPLRSDGVTREYGHGAASPASADDGSRRTRA
jgi:predicted metalloprotease with PDZ domain